MDGQLTEIAGLSRELTLLQRASQAFIATLDLDRVFIMVLEEVRRVMGVSACSVWLVDPLTDEMVCRQATGLQSEAVRGWRLPRGEGFVGWVVSHGQSLIVSDAQQDERHFRGVEEQTGMVARSILSAPLKTQHGVIGALQVVDTAPGRFGAVDLTLIEPLAASAAIAIDNARLVETLRQRTAELEARNEELSRFTYVASHNLRAPLVNLRGFAAELRLAFDAILPTVEAAAESLDERRRQIVIAALRDTIPEALKFIDSSVVQMDRMVNALLELSHLDRRALKVERVSMDAVAQSVLQRLSSLIAERQAQITVNELPDVAADRPSMEQVLDILLRNALLYLMPGRPGKIEIAAVGDARETVFSVRDNGRGIAEGDVQRIFAPFGRAGKSDAPGEGMGLAYAQVLIRRHGGRLWCESTPGQGTVFMFSLPVMI